MEVGAPVDVGAQLAEAGRRRQLVAATSVRRRRRSFGFGAVLVLLVLGVIAVPLVRRHAGASATLRIDGRAVTVPGRHPTVSTALRVAHVQPRYGVIRAVVSRREVGQVPPVVVVDGRTASLTTALRSGARVHVTPGADTVEGVVARPPVGAAAGLPDVERHLWHLPKRAVDHVLVGELSGEPVAEDGQAATPGALETDKVVALTFDDGPDPHWTPQVLQILREEGVPATFCLVGTAVRRHPELVAAEMAQGATLCDHTVHHDEHLDTAPHDRLVAEIQGGADAVTAAGAEPRFYRPPGGTLSPDVIAVAHQRGLRVLTWSVDPHDYRRPPVALLLRRVLDTVGPGAIILLHDGGGDRSNTVAALRPLIAALRAQGYRFTTPAME